MLEAKPPGCVNPRHVSGLPLYDYREALRPSTRLGPPAKKSSKKRTRLSARDCGVLNRA